MFEITLNPNQGLFFIPGRFHLTFENPGPVRIDPSNYSQQEKNWINNAARVNKITVKNLSSVSTEKSSDSIKDPKPNTIREQFFKNRETLHQQALEIIGYSNKTAIKTIKQITDLVLLRHIQQIELTDKIRLPVLDALKVRIDALTIQAMSVVGEPLNIDLITPEDAKLPSVESSDEEVVTIQLGDKE